MRKAEHQPEALELNSLVQEVAHFAEVEARWHDVFIELRLTEPLPKVMADGVLIEQVILNLARNAIEAMAGADTSGPKLTIQTQVNGGNMLQVTISDTGPGLSPQALMRVFEPFFTTKPTGMGMGLSICQSIIEAHSGRLWATPNSHLGTTFLLLPIQISLSSV